MIARLPPRQDVLARRDAIVAGLRPLLPTDAVISEPLLLKPYETGSTTARRQVPLAVVLAETTAQVAAINLLQPDLANGLRERKLNNLRATRADVVAAGNIGCMTQLAGHGLPVVHTVELLDWMAGGPEPEGLRVASFVPHGSGHR
jgi:hypothetical protein